MPVLTLGELADHLGHEDALDGMTVANAVEAANEAVVQWCGRDFDDAGSVSARVFVPLTATYVEVDDFHTITGLVVKTDDNRDGTFETTWAAADYQLEPLNGRQSGITVPWWVVRAVDSQRFPVFGERATVEVSAQWGWASVPDAVKEAALIKAARLWRRKDAIDAISGFDQLGGVVRISSREDPDVVSLLAPFRRAPLVVA